jgi:hypothetical protein
MNKILGQFVGVLLFLTTVAVFGLVVMFLWNMLLPSIFGLPIINYWQAAGLLILARLLFGGIDGSQIRRHKNPFRDKWIGMNEKDREAFMTRHRNGFPFEEFGRGNRPTNEGERSTFNEGDRRNRPPYEPSAEKN